MKVQPVDTISQNQMRFNGYRDLSKQILKSDRSELINLAEYFFNAPEKELREVTKSSTKAYNLLKEAVDKVVLRKQCYLADGASFCKKRAEELDAKANSRHIFMA